MNDFSRRFLSALGAPREAPQLEYLSRLCQRHLDTVPYENVSKLLRLAANKRDLPTADEYLAGLEEFGFGGTCYATNYYFARLLAEVGFDATLVGGRSKDGVRDHLGIRVRIDGVNFAVDLGFMSPEPGPFSLVGPVREMYFGSQLYRFIPAGDGVGFTFQVSRHGSVGREFVSDPAPHEIGQFAGPIEDSFGAERLFIKTLCISRRFGDHFKTIWGREFGIVRGKEATRRTIASRSDLAQIVHEEMGLPRYPLDAALGH
jgi:arylamine N-acetyltransferase